MAAQEKTAFKDWFDRNGAIALGRQIGAVYPDFDEPRFVRLSVRKLSTLEMGDRVKQFSDSLAVVLPDHYPDAIAIVTRSLPALTPDNEPITEGWLQWPVGRFIADYGQDHFTESMEAMVELTKRFTSEFAVRPFVEHQPDATFKFIYAQLQNSNQHVRRWCSEGTRTRLPWGCKLHDLIADPSPVWPILDALRNDEALYVRRSVANNLNDLSKDHPQAVLARCRLWAKDKDPNTDWIIRHALRGLIKAGNTSALAITGYKKPTRISATLSIKPARLKIGESLNVTATVTNGSTKKQALLVDYVVHYKGKLDGRRAKVFKWKSITLAAKEIIELKKSHAMRVTTIRALYPGAHRIELQVNGVIIAEAKFQLLAA